MTATPCPCRRCATGLWCRATGKRAVFAIGATRCSECRELSFDHWTVPPCPSEVKS